jgi:hypothetical protein
MAVVSFLDQGWAVTPGVAVSAVEFSGGGVVSGRRSLGDW